jgi:hypothetical protein
MRRTVQAERAVKVWRKRGGRGKMRRTITVARVRLRLRTTYRKGTCHWGFLSHYHQSLPLPVT